MDSPFKVKISTSTISPHYFANKLTKNGVKSPPGRVANTPFFHKLSQRH
jgi:hypothetical protein